MLVIENYSAIVSSAELEKNLSNKKITALVEKLNKIETKFVETYLFLLDADAIAGIKHLQSCIYFGIKAFQQKTNTANSLKAEILLYISGNRQISKAIQKVGLSTKSSDILLVQLVKNDEAVDHSQKPMFNFTEFLQQENVNVANFTFDVLDFKPRHYQKVMKNLKITEKRLSLFVIQNDEDYSYENVVEKMAIEKSALLNLNK
ncbi:MAG: hypothetical protein FK733_18250 [Asgard group archaeon]|nr:hypothetical protein [Asgard group archaeon]